MELSVGDEMEMATLGGDAAHEGCYLRASAPSFEDALNQEGRLSATTTVSSIEATMTARQPFIAPSDSSVQLGMSLGCKRKATE